MITKKIFIKSILISLISITLFLSLTSYAVASQNDIDLGQLNVLGKISQYLEKNHTDDKKIIDRFKNSRGYCHGISVLWLYCKWLSMQPNPMKVARDDFEWFDNTIKLIANWDESVILTDEEKNAIERFISYIEYHQNTPAYFPRSYAPGGLERYLENENGVKPKKVYDVLLTLDTKKGLSDILKTTNFIQDKTLVYIVANKHATALFKRENGYFYYFDPNCPKGEILYQSLDDVTDHILGAHNNPISINFSMFSFEADNLEPYPRINSTNTKNKDITREMFLTAVKRGHTEIVERLLEIENENKVDVNAIDVAGKTALTYALENGHAKIVKILLENNADLNLNNTTLISAAMNGHTEIVRILLEKNADANLATPDGKTALIFAAEHGYTEIVKILLEYNADANKVDSGSGGMTALMYAAHKGYIEIVRILLEYNADANKVDSGDSTALEYAVVEGYTEIAKLLKKQN